MQTNNTHVPGCPQPQFCEKSCIRAVAIIAVALMIIGGLGLSSLNLGIPMSGAISMLAVGSSLFSISCMTIFIRNICSVTPANPPRAINQRFPPAQRPIHPPAPAAAPRPAPRIEGVEGPLPPPLSLEARRRDLALPQSRTIVEELAERLRATNHNWYAVTEQLLRAATVVLANTQPPDDSAVDCHDRLFIPIGPGSPQTRPYIIVSDRDRDALSMPGHQRAPLSAKQMLEFVPTGIQIEEIHLIAALLRRRYAAELGGSFTSIIYALFDRVVRSCRQEDDDGALLDLFMNPRDPATLGRLMNDPEIMPRLARIATALLLRECVVLDRALRISRQQNPPSAPYILAFADLNTLEMGQVVPNPLMDNPKTEDRVASADGWSYTATRGLCLMEPFQAAQAISALSEPEFYAFLEVIRQGRYDQLSDDFLRTSQLVMNAYLYPYVAEASRERVVAVQSRNWRATVQQQFTVVDPHARLGGWVGANCYFACCLAQLTPEHSQNLGDTTQQRLNAMRELTGAFMDTPEGIALLGAGPLLNAARIQNRDQDSASEVVMRALAHALNRPVHIYYGERGNGMEGIIRNGILQPDMIFNAESNQPPILVLTGLHCMILIPRHQ